MVLCSLKFLSQQTLQSACTQRERREQWDSILELYRVMDNQLKMIPPTET